MAANISKVTSSKSFAARSVLPRMIPCVPASIPDTSTERKTGVVSNTLLQALITGLPSIGIQIILNLSIH